jgi:hypothetical protein
MYVKAVSALQQAVKISACLKGCILRGNKSRGTDLDVDLDYDMDLAEKVLEKV